MELFDFIKVFFTDPVTYNTLPDSVKNKNFFMFNRYISIEYPSLANYFNIHGKVNGARILDVYHKKFVSKPGRVPTYFYTKAKSREKSGDANFKIKSDEAFKKYLHLKRISYKDFLLNVQYDYNGQYKEEYIHFEKSYIAT